MPEPMTPPPTMGERRDYRLLIVEDEDSIREVFSLMVCHAFHVESVATWKETVERLRNTAKPKINAILLDLNLPNGQGLDLISRLVQLCPHIPVIVATGYDYSATEVIRRGAQDLLTKPEITQPVLIRVIARAIARQEVRPFFQTIGAKVDEIKDAVSITTKPPSSGEAVGATSGGSGVREKR